MCQIEDVRNSEDNMPQSLNLDRSDMTQLKINNVEPLKRNFLCTDST